MPILCQLKLKTLENHKFKYGTMYNLTHFRHMIKNKLLLSDHKSFKEPLTVGIGPVRGFLSLIFFINTKTICKFNNTTYNVLRK